MHDLASQQLNPHQQIKNIKILTSLRNKGALNMIVNTRFLFLTDVLKSWFEERNQKPRKLQLRLSLQFLNRLPNLMFGSHTHP